LLAAGAEREAAGGDLGGGLSGARFCLGMLLLSWRCDGAWWCWPGCPAGLTEPGGGTERGLGLVGTLLCLAQLSDGLGEHGELDDQFQRRERLVVGEVPEGGDESGGLTELVPYRRR
jgi:hypothetical protein